MRSELGFGPLRPSTYALQTFKVNMLYWTCWLAWFDLVVLKLALGAVTPSKINK